MNWVGGGVGLTIAFFHAPRSKFYNDLICVTKTKDGYFPGFYYFYTAQLQQEPVFALDKNENSPKHRLSNHYCKLRINAITAVRRNSNYGQSNDTNTELGVKAKTQFY